MRTTIVPRAAGDRTALTSATHFWSHSRKVLHATMAPLRTFGRTAARFCTSARTFLVAQPQHSLREESTGARGRAPHTGGDR